MNVRKRKSAVAGLADQLQRLHTNSAELVTCDK